MASVEEMVAFGVREKLKEFQSLCKDVAGAVRRSVIGVIELYREVLEMTGDDAMLADRINYLGRKLEDAQSVKRLACVKPEVASALKEALEVKVEDPVAKYAQMVDKTAQTGENL